MSCHITNTVAQLFGCNDYGGTAISVTAVIDDNKLVAINVASLKDIEKHVELEAGGKYDVVVNMRCVPIGMLKTMD